VIGAVAAAASFLHLHVSVTRRFEGRLWELPARIYSDALVLAPGDAVDLDRVVARLARTGYVETADAEPRRPGQFRRRGGMLELQARAFAGGGLEIPAGKLTLRARGGRLASVRDERGRSVARAILEPELLATLFGPRQEARELVRLRDVPAVLRHAVLAAEDARFFEHHGVDARSVLRAAWANLRHRRVVQGGSTITQQTVKNLFLRQERTWWRKLREALMAVVLDARYDKSRILEAYLNEVYLGQRGSVAICGVQAAARFYFGRDVRDLSLAESAMLAGLIRSPGRYSPFADAAQARERRDHVLDAMRRLGFVTGREVAAARGERLRLASSRQGFLGGGYAVDEVRAQLERLAPAALEQGDLRVYTTLDTVWLEAAEGALADGLARLEGQVPVLRGQRGQRVLQGAVVVLEPATGAIRALVGGRDHDRSQFNRAVQAHRQPGSCFKPFVYAAGFEQAVRAGRGGLSPATLLEDSPLEIESGGRLWRPVNHDRRYRGHVTARRALVESLNVPTVRAAQLVGLQQVVDGARRLGIRSPLVRVPSLALGAAEVSPLELAAAYASLANGGRHVPPGLIRTVEDSGGRVLFHERRDATQAISPEAAYLVNSVLQEVLRNGTAKSASTLGYRGNAAAKTGTTDDTRDAWFVGYTPEWLGLVWVGYDEGARTGLTGATGALPIWVDLVRRGGAEDSSAPFTVPQGLVRARIDPETGELARQGCPTWCDEWLLASHLPPPCSAHGNRFRRWLRQLFGEPERDQSLPSSS
jgi:penicillin-binding protein 1B